MRKATALFLLTLLLPLRAVEWRDNVYACSANLPESAGWAPIQVPEIPGLTVLVAMQNPGRQAVFGVNVLNSPPSANLNDDTTVKALEQMLHGFTYQFIGHSTVQVGGLNWLQYPVTSTSGGQITKGVVRFTSAYGRVYSVSMLLGGGKEASLDMELQQAAASFRFLPLVPVATPKPAPVLAATKNDKAPAEKVADTAPAPVVEEKKALEPVTIGIIAGGGLLILLVLYKITRSSPGTEQKK